MDYSEIGKRIRDIREKELKVTREKFAETLEISNSTLARIENPGKQKVTNVEVYWKISQATGYSMEELMVGIYSNNNDDREIKRINYLLKVLPKRELEYIFKSIQEFVRFMHKGNTRTLKDIKKDLK